MYVKCLISYAKFGVAARHCYALLSINLGGCINALGQVRSNPVAGGGGEGGGGGANRPLLSQVQVSVVQKAHQ